MIGDDRACSERLAELEQLQADLVFATAHRLRTPLTVLRAHAELLASGELDASARDSVSAMVCAARQLEDISNELIAEMRTHAGGAEPALRRWLEAETGPASRFARRRLCDASELDQSDGAR